MVALDLPNEPAKLRAVHFKDATESCSERELADELGLLESSGREVADRQMQLARPSERRGRGKLVRISTSDLTVVAHLLSKNRNRRQRPPREKQNCTSE